MSSEPPAVEALRFVRREIDALSSSIQKQSAKLVLREEIIQRVQDIFFSWFSSTRNTLIQLGVQERILSKVDARFSWLIRLSERRSRKKDYLIVLRGLRRAIVQEVLLDVARLLGATRSGQPRSRPTRMIPQIPDVPNELIPYSLAGWIPRMQDFLRQHTFDRNVFVMVAYRKKLDELIDQISDGLNDLGLNAIVARDHRLTDDLYNPLACLLCCNYGVAIFDQPEKKQTHNPNVVYELGMMQLLKRRCIILKHKKLPVMPSDLLSRLYEPYATEDEAVSLVKAWAQKLIES